MDKSKERINRLKGQLQSAKEKIQELTEKNRSLREENKNLRTKYKTETTELKAKLKLLENSTKKMVTIDGKVRKTKVGKWKQFTEDYPQLAEDYYKCVKKYGWVVQNHYHLAGYLRKLVEGDEKEGIPPQMTAERLARRYAFLAAIPDNWWNGNILFGPPPKTETKGQQRINDLNNLIATNSTVKAFWKKFSKTESA